MYGGLPGARYRAELDTTHPLLVLLIEETEAMDSCPRP
jgi:hypothetical protein